MTMTHKIDLISYKAGVDDILKEIDKIMDKEKSFLLDSNEIIHTHKKGIIMGESLVMNNFLVDWFEDVKNRFKLLNSAKLGSEM